MVLERVDINKVVRQRCGLSRSMYQTALNLCGGKALEVKTQYDNWRAQVLTTVGDRTLTTKELADVLGCDTAYIAQLKYRQMLKWSEVGPKGFGYTAAEIRQLFELSETWMRGGSSVVGSRAMKGPMGHLFVRWLENGSSSPA